MKRVIHFEIPSEDPEKAIGFYSSVFGWTFQPFSGNDYYVVKTGSGIGIDGGLMKKRDPDQPVVNTIEVDDIDSSLKKIVQFGGTIVVEKFQIPGVGIRAFFKDIDGHIVGVVESRKINERS